MLKIKKHLSLQPLIEGFKTKFGQVDDDRRTESVHYDVLDTALSGLACMFYKSGDMATYQQRMKLRCYKNSFETQFGVRETPKDNQMRTILGTIPSESFRPVYKDYLTRLQRGKELYKFNFHGKYLVALDGTQYHYSSTINCPCCLVKRNKKAQEVIGYSHQALQPIICHPDQKQILPLMPEDIANTDGNEKQDCEVNAAKRLLPKIRKDHPRMSFIWVADSLYATDPFISKILEHKEDYIFRVQKGDHKHLFTTIDSLEHKSHKTIGEKSTVVHHYYENVPLNGSSKITVNVIRAYVITQDKQGNQKSTITGVWITNMALNDEVVADITKAARSRWKVENECFNALKNNGYELTHNWGHKKGESFVIYNLIMLAFYIHQILEMTDGLFKLCRKVSRTFKELWTDLTYHFKYILFDSWEHMLCFHLNQNEHPPPKIV